MNISTATVFGKRSMNRIDSRDYIEWAVGMLVEGKDSSNLRMLAGLDPWCTIFEAEEHFNRALKELQILEPDKAGKFRGYACELADQIISGTLEAKAGVKALHQIYLATDYASEYEVWNDLDDTCDLVEHGIYPVGSGATPENLNEVVKAEAREFLAKMKKPN